MPDEAFHRIRITSAFGKMVVLVMNGFLPFSYGHETTGYEVADLNATLSEAQFLGVEVLAPHASRGRQSTIVKFPGGYIAEMHFR
jgi:hypothetical protein